MQGPVNLISLWVPPPWATQKVLNKTMASANASLKPLFLFTLPRSGSTLCQRVLAAHPQIATTTEPHLLLPFFYAFKERELYGHYHQEQQA